MGKPELLLLIHVGDHFQLLSRDLLRGEGTGQVGPAGIFPSEQGMAGRGCARRELWDWEQREGLRGHPGEGGGGGGACRGSPRRCSLRVPVRVPVPAPRSAPLGGSAAAEARSRDGQWRSLAAGP